MTLVYNSFSSWLSLLISLSFRLRVICRVLFLDFSDWFYVYSYVIFLNDVFFYLKSYCLNVFNSFYKEFLTAYKCLVLSLCSLMINSYWRHLINVSYFCSLMANIFCKRDCLISYVYRSTLTSFLLRDVIWASMVL